MILIKHDFHGECYPNLVFQEEDLILLLCLARFELDDGLLQARDHHFKDLI